MRYLLIFLGICIVSCSVAMDIAVFSEKDFPNNSAYPPEFYVKELNAIAISLEELETKLQNFNILLFPHGGYVPGAAEIPVSKLLDRGGIVIITGDLQSPPSAGSLSGPLEFDEDSQKWLVEAKGATYNLLQTPAWFNEFDLQGWPNPAQSYARAYMRAFNQEVTVNEKLKSSLPTKIQPQKNKEINLARLAPVTTIGDYAFDVFVPLYLFEKPSGNPYPPYKDAGKSAEDCAADAFIYRRFRQKSFGGTLVVLGEIGKVLLESENAATTIKEIIRLARNPLPGEFEHTYIRKIMQLEQMMADYNQINQSLQVALAAVASTKVDQRVATLALMKQNIREFNRLNNSFETIQALKNNRKIISEKQIENFQNDLQESIAKRQKLLQKNSQFGKAIDHGDAEHAYKRHLFVASNFGPWNLSRDEFWSKVQDIGITSPSLYNRDWQLMQKLNEKYDFSTTYRLWYYERGHEEKQKVSSGIFNPDTGTVREVSASVFTGDTPILDEELIANLDKANKNDGVSIVIHGAERDLQWSLWGDWMRGKFIGYLQEKYKHDIAALNNEYNYEYASFEDIKLPLKRPETQSEHALWEDWTRYREIYRIEDELRHRVELVKNYAPNKKQWLYGSYHMQKRHPANGINFYELGKLLDPACLESGSQQSWKEIIAADITAFNKKHINTEWADFYFAAGSQRDSINRMRQSLWNEATAGTIAWYLFMGGTQGGTWKHTPLITPAGLIQPTGYELRNITRDFYAARKLFLDGKRTEPEIRFVYSPTTRRHTSWPRIEEDRSMECVAGWNDSCKKLHIPGRAIDEQAIMEGKLSDKCRFLILPRVEFLNRDLFEQLKSFMEKGGTLIASADSGRYDQYGHRINLLSRMAGIRVIERSLDIFPEFDLEILFPQESKVLLTENNKIIATETQVGKGRLIITNKELGQIYNTTGKGLDKIDELLAAVGVKRLFRCDDQNLVIRPWRLNGEDYLTCHYIYKANLAGAAGSFPLASPPAMVEFNLELAGSYDIEDWLLGTKLDITYENGISSTKAIIENPGGKIYRLIPRQSAAAIDSFTPVKQQQQTENLNIKKKFDLPCTGQFFADWGQILIADGVLVCEAENEGAWQGKVFASFTRGNQTLRRECVPGEKIWFHFVDKTIVFACENVSAVMPAHITGSFSETLPQKADDNCILTVDKNEVTMQNSQIFVKILPDFGGRIAELRSSAKAPNHLLIRPDELAKGIGTTYRDFGGLEYTPGVYQGPGWELQYETEVISNTPEEISVILKRTKPVRIPRGSTISYEIVYTLAKNSSMLNCKVRQYNEDALVTQLRLTTHPLLQIAGDVNLDDNFYWKTDKGVGVGLFKARRNEYLPNHGDWLAYIDARAASGIIHTFASEQMPRIYAWNGSQAYNVELPFMPVETKVGEFAEFHFNLGVLNGFNALTGHENGILAELINDSNKLTARIAATSRRLVNFYCQITQNGKTIQKFPTKKVELLPGTASSYSFDWNADNLPDATYVFELNCDSSIFQQEIIIDKDSEKAEEQKIAELKLQLNKLQQKYRENPSAELRKEILNLVEKF